MKNITVPELLFKVRHSTQAHTNLNSTFNPTKLAIPMTNPSSSYHKTMSVCSLRDMTSSKDAPHCTKGLFTQNHRW